MMKEYSLSGIKCHLSRQVGTRGFNNSDVVCIDSNRSFKCAGLLEFNPRPTKIASSAVLPGYCLKKSTDCVAKGHCKGEVAEGKCVQKPKCHHYFSKTLKSHCKGEGAEGKCVAETKMSPFSKTLKNIIMNYYVHEIEGLYFERN